MNLYFEDFTIQLAIYPSKQILQSRSTPTTLQTSPLKRHRFHQQSSQFWTPSFGYHCHNLGPEIFHRRLYFYYIEFSGAL